MKIPPIYSVLTLSLASGQPGLLFCEICQVSFPGSTEERIRQHEQQNARRHAGPQVVKLTTARTGIMIDKTGVIFEPWTDRGNLGFRMYHPDGRIEYLYLNPSSESDDNQPNVFLYHGTAGDPAVDSAVIYQDVFRPQAGGNAHREDP